ncbi:MAG: hypothetical protein KBF73_06425, partial [Flavobacteriales bacterium]|nr:hypothetical protein [Flavobacteriales bacterium]
MRNLYCLVILVMIGCTSQPEIITTSLNQNNLIEILEQHNFFDIDSANYFREKGIEYIVAVLKPNAEKSRTINVIKLVKIAGQWQEEARFSKEFWPSTLDGLIDGGDSIVPSFSYNYVTVEDTPYLYLELAWPGAGSNYSADFCMLNLHSLTNYCIEYYAVSEIDGWSGGFKSKHSDSVRLKVQVLMDSIIGKSLYLVKKQKSKLENSIDEWRRHHAHLYENGAYPVQTFWKVAVSEG